MKEQLTSFETARLAREKGFKGVPCFHCFDMDGKDQSNGDMYTNQPTSTYIARPTQSLLQKWLRDKQDISLCVVQEGLGYGEFCYVWQIWTFNMKKQELEYIDSFSGSGSIYVGGWNKYEDALEDGLQQALKLIEQQQQQQQQQESL